MARVGGKRRKTHFTHVANLRNKIVRYDGTLWRVDSMNGDYAYIRPLTNAYGEGCKTVPASAIHDSVEGGKRRHARHAATNPTLASLTRDLKRLL